MTPSSLHDPHNNVPEVTPDDDWGDHHESDGTAAGMLPPRKQRADPAKGRKGAEQQGFRIGMKDEPAPEPVAVESAGLVVEEIDGTVTRLEATMPAPSIAERPAVFIERPAKDPADVRHVGEARDWGHRPKGSVRWIVGTGFGIAALVVLVLMALPAINSSNAARPDPSAGIKEPAKPDDEELRIRELMIARPKVEPLVKAYVTSGVADDLLRLVRHPETVASLIRAERRPPLAPSSWEVPAAAEWLVHSQGGQFFGEMIGTYPDFSPFRIYVVMEDGQFRIDWKASTAYSTSTFGELAGGEGDGSEIRGTLEPSNFFTTAFPEEDYQSYRLDSPDGDQSLWVYTKRGSDADREIGELFASGAILSNETKQSRVTVSLRRTGEEAHDNQWEVGELLSPAWIEPKTDSK